MSNSCWTSYSHKVKEQIMFDLLFDVCPWQDMRGFTSYNINMFPQPFGLKHLVLAPQILPLYRLNVSGLWVHRELFSGWQWLLWFLPIPWICTPPWGCSKHASHRRSRPHEWQRLPGDLADGFSFTPHPGDNRDDDRCRTHPRDFVPTSRWCPKQVSLLARHHERPWKNTEHEGWHSGYRLWNRFPPEQAQHQPRMARLWPVTTRRHATAHRTFGDQAWRARARCPALSPYLLQKVASHRRPRRPRRWRVTAETLSSHVRSSLQPPYIALLMGLAPPCMGAWWGSPHCTCRMELVSNARWEKQDAWAMYIDIYEHLCIYKYICIYIYI